MLVQACGAFPYLRKVYTYSDSLEELTPQGFLAGPRLPAKAGHPGP